MKLREQSLLAVVPLFLMIGLTGAGASLLLKSYEWRKGMEAEYMGTEHWSSLPVGAIDPLAAPEKRMDRWGFLRGIQIWNNDGELIHRWPRPESVEALNTKLAPQVAVDRATADNAYGVGQLEQGPSEGAVIRGGAGWNVNWRRSVGPRSAIGSIEASCSWWGGFCFWVSCWPCCSVAWSNPISADY